jgi:transketolase N-terminal domain/subunit
MGEAFCRRYERSLSVLQFIMDQNTSALERAFQLAKSGRCASVQDVKRDMKKEGYSVSQVTGRMLQKQLNALIEEARSNSQNSLSIE